MSEAKIMKTLVIIFTMAAIAAAPAWTMGPWEQEVSRVNAVFVANYTDHAAPAVCPHERESGYKLCLAARDNDAQEVKRLIRCGVDVNSMAEVQNAYGMEGKNTALMYAALQSNPDIVKILISNGADRLITGQNGTALRIAINHGHEAVAEILIDEGLDDRFKCSQFKSAAYDGSARIVKRFIFAGLDVNECTGALQLAAHYGNKEDHEEIMEVLIDAGDDVNAKTLSGWTILMFAAKKFSADTVRKLIARGADVNEAPETKSALLLAITNDNADSADILIDAGANVNIRDGRGRTPLSYAAAKNSISTVRKLIIKGADMNTQDERGRTPLSYAADMCSVDAARKLIVNGAKINARDEEGKTALITAAMAPCGTIIEMLIAKRAHLNVRDNWGKTALMYADENGYPGIVSMLLEAGAKCNIGCAPKKKCPGQD
ncbi:ankyrin repeat domain-containing protein [Elusimicrobiota bacterium]